MPKRKRPAAESPALFDLEPGAPQQETPAPSSPWDTDRFALEFVYDLTAPFIGYPGWGDDPQFWEPHKTRVTMERLLHHQEIHRDKVASEYETMLYLSSASLARPMSHDWVQVYFYLFTRCMGEQAKVIGNDVKELDPGQQGNLSRLRRWLYKNQMEHVKAKHKAAAGEEPAPPPEVLEHPKLF